MGVLCELFLICENIPYWTPGSYGLLGETRLEKLWRRGERCPCGDTPGPLYLSGRGGTSGTQHFRNKASSHKIKLISFFNSSRFVFKVRFTQCKRALLLIYDYYNAARHIIALLVHQSCDNYCSQKNAVWLPECRVSSWGRGEFGTANLRLSAQHINASKCTAT